MTADKIIDSIKINFRENNAQEIRVAAFLRSQKEIGKELKAEITKPLYSFIDTYAVGEDPNSTLDEIETTFITSMIAMSSQMSSLSLYCRVKHGINLSPDSWRTFGLLHSPIPGTSEYIPPIFDKGSKSGIAMSVNDDTNFHSEKYEKGRADTRPTTQSRTLIDESLTFMSPEVISRLVDDPTETTCQRLSRENQELSDEIDREIVDRSSTQPNLVPEDEDYDEEYEKYKNTEDEDDDYDPDDDLTDDEYAAKVLARIPNNQMVITD
jgi:hypothetical protein